MKKMFITLSTFLVLINYSLHVYAGTPQTTMECKSESNHATITGSPQGDSFDLKIKIDDATIRYTDACDDTQCSKKENYGMLTVVDVLFDKVFTISFANSDGNNRGIFYALPDTVKYKKNSRGYTVKYQAIYWGDDPRSTETYYKAFVKDPGVKFVCTQQNKI